MGISLPRLPRAVDARPPTSGFDALKDSNSALLREDLAARREVFRALPEVVSLYTTDVCNLRCGMCPRSIEQGSQILDREVLGRLCRDVFPTARKAVLTAAAGEPLLADFDLVLDRALEFGVRLDVITNGTYLTQDVYAAARGALDHVNVSLDAPDAELYERIRVGSSFARVVANLRSIVELRRREPDGVLLSVSFLVMRSNLPVLAEFVRLAADIGVDGVVCQRLQHTVKATREEDPERLGAEAVEGHFERARAAAEALGVNLLLAEVGRENVLPAPPRAKVPAPVEGHGSCWFVAQNMGVLYNGDVYPCCVPTDHRFGNLFDTPAREIWNGAPARALRRAHFAGRGTSFCRGCHHAPLLPAARPGAAATRRVRIAAGHLKTLARDRVRGPAPATGAPVAP